jgi:very-short-patch-repair endonuclease/predicted transcriptional regulator of viral defense system
MGSPQPDKRSKPARPPQPGTDIRSLPEFRGSILSEQSLGHILRAHPGASDLAAAAVAERQLGLVTTEQLNMVGLSRDAIMTRCRRGNLHRVYHGVYLLGIPPMPPGARELAAVLACGGSGLVSHRSAAVLWGMVDPLPSMHVTVVGRKYRSREGLKVHRSSHLDPLDATTKNGIPLTAPARTLIDFAGEADDSELERAISEARMQRLVDDRDLEAALRRAGNRRGVARMREILRSEGEPGYTRSEAERQMRRLIEQARLPPPRVNARIGGFEVDFYWPGHKLIVEVDGFRFHGHRAAFERDRRKDMTLVAAGYLVIRVTWRQLTEEPLAVAATIASALAAGHARSDTVP